MKKWVNLKYLNPVFETNTNYAEWFGYYNYKVISCDGKKMLCNRSEFDGREITASDKIDLGWYNIETGEWNYIDTTDSFNWPQGAMLQWLPGKENDNKVIYNISKDGHFKSVIYDIDTGAKKYVDFPIYSITPDGRYSISLNYERSYWCRAYHYQSVVNTKYNVQVAEDDGIFMVDLNNNSVRRIISIQDIISLDAPLEFSTIKHWIEHIMMNKQGTEIAFLHRFSTTSGYGTRVVTANINGGELSVVEGWRSKDLSHLGWINSKSFAIYSVTKVEPYQYITEEKKATNISVYDRTLIIKKALRMIIPTSLVDYLRGRHKGYDVCVKNNESYDFICNYSGRLLNIDGHPSFTSDGRYMITDSYPDKSGYQRLVIFNTITRKAVLVAKFYSPLRNKSWGCDLHPKLCFNDNYIIVDSAYSGKRRMLVFEINWDRLREEEKQ